MERVRRGNMLGMKGRKGLIFTIDAMIALFAASILLSSSLYMPQSQSIKWNSIHPLAMDSLATLEIDGSLKNAAETGSMADIKLFLDNVMPDNTCAKIDIYNRTSSSALLSEIRSGCVSSGSLSVSRRVFIADSRIYHARMEAWFK